ncbi:MAG: hypothetical protein JSR27_05095 [Proteobacteria bacterium]|nr:hypothetical protein [Pseudomonadota bacterium]
MPGVLPERRLRAEQKETLARIKARAEAKQEQPKPDAEQGGSFRHDDEIGTESPEDDGKSGADRAWRRSWRSVQPL